MARLCFLCSSASAAACLVLLALGFASSGSLALGDEPLVECSALACPSYTGSDCATEFPDNYSCLRQEEGCACYPNDMYPEACDCDDAD
jgi:hypothetical protein